MGSIAKQIAKHKIVSIILLIILVVGGSFTYAYLKVFTSPKIPSNLANKIINKNNQLIPKKTGPDIKTLKGNYNILLIGIDTRENDFSGRTDSMILVSFDTKNHAIKLMSIMRDLYVNIPGHGGDRINAAYEYGGPSLLFETLKENFGLNIDKYALVNFRSFQKIVDDIGGVDINVKQDEINILNSYQKEINKSPILVTKPGLQHLNGEQALGYCRIRYVGNNDFERTQRQRSVIMEIIKKSRSMSVWKIPQLAYDLIPYVKTNVPMNDIIKLAYTVYKDKNFAVDSYSIPGDNMYTGQTIRGMMVLVPDLNKCSKAIEDYLVSGKKD